MPNDVDVAESSAVEDIQDAMAPTSSAEDAPEQSGDGEGYDRAELMQVVRKAIGDVPEEDEQEVETEAEAESPTAEGQEEGLEEAPEGEAEPEGEADLPEDYSDVPFHEHPRFKQLIQEKNDLKSQVEQLSAGASEWENVSRFMAENNLEAETMGRMYTSVAGLNGQAIGEMCDYMDAIKQGRVQEALKMARDQVAELELLTGDALSPDLRRRIDDGVVDQETALQLSQTQAQLAMEKRQREREAALAEQRSAQDRQRNLQDAVRKWEAQTRKEDPDFGRKHKFVYDRLASAVAREMPTSQQGAVDLVNGIYSEVSEELAAMNGGRTVAKKSVTGGSSPRAPAAEPKSMLEAVQQALQSAGG